MGSGFGTNLRATPSGSRLFGQPACHVGNICNPADAPTHSRGAALDIVIVSPGAVESVLVHSPNCSCANAALCCPLLCSDPYAVEINVATRPMPSTRVPVEHPLHVRDWEQLIRAQERDVRQWLRRTRAHFSNPSVQHSQKRGQNWMIFMPNCCTFCGTLTPACTAVPDHKRKGSRHGGMMRVFPPFLKETLRGVNIGVSAPKG